MRVILAVVLLTVHVAVLAGRQTGEAGTAAAAASASDAALMDTLMAAGAEVYGVDCMECHADGGMGPTLVANSRLSDKDLVIKAILLGVSEGDMPAFGPTLTDHQIAAVSTYIRNTQENTHGIVIESDVKRVRDATGKK
jgi:cytochrome c oxidase subunit 2